MSASATHAQRRLPLVPIAVAAIVLAAVVAVVASLGSSEPATPEAVEFSDVTVEGQSLPPLEPGTADSAIGQPAPALTGNGPNHALVDVQPGDQPLILAFMAHWCPHCQNELPVVSDWLAGGGADGVEVVAVSTGVDPAKPNFPPSAWFEREGFTGPVLVDDEAGSVAQAYGLPAFPYFVFVDADGRVAGRVVGELTPAQLDEAVEQLQQG